MNRRVLIGIIMAAVAVLLVTLAFMTSQPSTHDNAVDTTKETQVDSTESDEMTESEVTVEPVSVATITYMDDGFRPSTTTVKKGATITVTNNSSVNVMFSSADHPTHEEQSELNMDILKPGESGTITVTKVGTWGYHDHVDASMMGTIVVTE